MRLFFPLPLPPKAVWRSFLNLIERHGQLRLTNKIEALNWLCLGPLGPALDQWIKEAKEERSDAT